MVKGHLSTIFFAEAGDIVAPLMSVGSRQITELATRGLAPRAEALLPAYHRYNVSCVEEGDLLRSPLDLIIELAADDTDGVQSAATVTVIRFSGRTRRANACLTSSAVTA
ncbi:hypothetical protein SDC9_196983 [bioreactor metagenome]|uniref:Uncharacterized protein n=1 Tax=bioreactor metagenome TaxID=1076179 RepID=A0A645IQ37_9ZZZZ